MKPSPTTVWASRIAVGAALITAAAALTVSMRTAQGERDQLAEQAAPLAAVVQQECVTGGQPATALVAKNACRQAARVLNAPAVEDVEVAPPPQEPAGGRDGRGITRTRIAAGQLQVTYTDGDTENLGRVVGRNGRQGAGGDDGRDGSRGADGRSVVSTNIVGSELVVLYSDGSTITVGPVVGPAGRGVASLSITADFRLQVTYTDGTTSDVGPLPRGPAGQDGQDGRGITSRDYVRTEAGACVERTTYSRQPSPVDLPVGDALCQPSQPPPSEPASQPGDPQPPLPTG